MDMRRTLLWGVFIFSLVMLWDAWLKHGGQPSLWGGTPVNASAPAQGQAVGVTPSDTGVPTVAAETSGVLAQGVPGSALNATALPSTKAQLNNDVFKVDIDTRGGEIYRVELLKHKNTQNADGNVVLLNNSSERVYLARSGLIGAENLPNHRTLYEVVAQSPMELVLKAESGGLRLLKTYTAQPGRYDIQVKYQVTNTGVTEISPRLYLQIVRDGNAPQGESQFYSTFTGPAVYTDAEKFQKIKFSDIEKGQAKYAGSADNGWIAMIQHYFVTAWIPKQGVEREIQARKVDNNLYAINAIEKVGRLAPGASAEVQATFFTGPQEQKTLESLAPGLDLVVDYGWLTMLAKPLFWLLELFHRWTANWGWAIILLTLLVKLAFYPLSAASYKSMAKMRTVTPMMMKIREQYKNDRQKMNEAMMELYKREKINPVGGCLPMLVQIPVFIALYWTLLAAVEMRGAPWVGWIQDLTVPDPWYILPAGMILTMWVQFKLNPTPPDPVQAKVFAIMPLIFGGMMIFFPAGLVLYWVVNNVLSIAQQWQITRMIDGKPLFGRAVPPSK